MSIYNAFCGLNPALPKLLSIIDREASDFPRFRDVHLVDREGELLIAVFTRCGDVQRDHWDTAPWNNEEGGPHCECPGCRMSFAIPKFPGYRYDEDASADRSYAYIYFAVPSDWQNQLRMAHELVEDTDIEPEHKLELLIKRLMRESGLKAVDSSAMQASFRPIVDVLRKAMPETLYEHGD